MMLDPPLCDVNASLQSRTFNASSHHHGDEAADDSADWLTLDRAGNYMAIFFSGIVDILGTIGNSLLIFCLLRRKQLTSMLRILLSLAFADTVLLLINLMFQCVLHAHLITPIFNHSANLEALAVRVWPLSMAFHSIGILLTVYICVERWFAICKPLTVRSYLSPRLTNRFIFSIFTIGVLLHLPRFFEYESCVMKVTGKNESVLLNESASTSTDATIATTATTESEDQIVTIKTPFSQSFVYSTVYNVILCGTTVYVVPMVVITVLTVHMLFRLQRSRKFVYLMSIAQQREHSVSLLPLLIVIFFIVCETPVMLTNLLDAYIVQIDERLVRFLLACSSFLVVTRCASNIIFYSIFSKYMRRDLRSMVTTLKESLSPQAPIDLHTNTSNRLELQSVRSKYSSLFNRISNERRHFPAYSRSRNNDLS